MRHIAVPLAAPAAQHSFRAACRQQSPQRQRWIIDERATGAGVGLLGLFADGDAAEIGMMLVTPAHGRGYAGEALAAMVSQAFASTMFGLLWTRQAWDNGAMRSVMRKLGFVRADPIDPPQAQLRWHMSRVAWLARHENCGCAAAMAGTGKLTASSP